MKRIRKMMMMMMMITTNFMTLVTVILTQAIMTIVTATTTRLLLLLFIRMRQTLLASIVTTAMMMMVLLLLLLMLIIMRGQIIILYLTTSNHDAEGAASVTDKHHEQRRADVLYRPAEILPKLYVDAGAPGHDPDDHDAPDQNVERVTEPEPGHQPLGAGPLSPFWYPVHRTIKYELDLHGAPREVHSWGRVVPALAAEFPVSRRGWGQREVGCYACSARLNP